MSIVTVTTLHRSKLTIWNVRVTIAAHDFALSMSLHSLKNLIFVKKYPKLNTAIKARRTSYVMIVKLRILMPLDLK